MSIPAVTRMPEYLYEDCTVLRWVDGDTLDMEARARFTTPSAAFDPGFKILATVTQEITLQYTGRFRLLFVDAWERRDPLGPAATAFVNKLLPAGSAACARTFKDPDNFGRYLADLWVPEAPEFTISAQLIEQHLGVPYEH